MALKDLPAATRHDLAISVGRSGTSDECDLLHLVKQVLAFQHLQRSRIQRGRAAVLLLRLALMHFW